MNNTKPLLEEAIQKLGQTRCLLKTASNYDPVQHELLSEACDRLEWAYAEKFTNHLLKESQQRLDTWIRKYAGDVEFLLAGAKNLKNSSLNVYWTMEDPTPRISQIKDNIESIFRSYFHRVINGRQYASPAGLVLPEISPDNVGEDPREGEDSPKATIYFRFQYKRMIMPVGDRNNAFPKAESLLSGFETVCQGLKSFIKDLENNNISLQPYFNNSVVPNLYAPKIQKFIESDPTLTNGVLPRGAYKNYAAIAQETQSPLPTSAAATLRRFGNDEIDQIKVQGNLLNAIVRKVMLGFQLDTQGLKEDLDYEKQEALKRCEPKEQKVVSDFWDSKYQNIIGVWNAGNRPRPLSEVLASYEKREQDEQSAFTAEHGASATLPMRHKFNANYVVFEKPSDIYFFTKPSMMKKKVFDPQKIMVRPMLDVVRVKKTYQSKDLLQDEVEFILRHLTIPAGGSKRGRGRPRADAAAATPETFVAKVPMMYRSNGLDTVPSDTGDTPQSMPILPAMRVLPDGNLSYDRDTGNMGRFHLTESWYAPTHSNQDIEGIGGLRYIVQKWGIHAQRWIQILQTNGILTRVIDGIATGKQRDQIPYLKWAAQKAIDISIHSRTNAENFLITLSKYPDLEAFQQNHLRKTMSSEISTIKALKKANIDDSELGQVIPEYAASAKGLKGKSAKGTAKRLVDALVRQSEQEKTTLISLQQNIQQQSNAFMTEFPNESMNYNDAALVQNRQQAASQIEERQKEFREAYDQYKKVYGRHVLSLMSTFQKSIKDYDILTWCLAEVSRVTDLEENPLKPCLPLPNSDEVKTFPSVNAKVNNKTCIQYPDDFNLLKTYGYAIAKMMDFVSALMTLACRETFNNRVDGRSEDFYGRLYSCSSSKGAGGEVILSVYYAFRPQWEQIQGVNEDLKKKLKDRARARHARVGLNQPTEGQLLPQTQFAPDSQMAPLTEPQIDYSGPLMRIAKDVKFFVGLRGGRKGGGFRRGMFTSAMPTVGDWNYSFPKALEVFKQNYGDALGAINAIIEPMDLNIRRLDTAMKSAWEDVRQMISENLQQPVEAIYTNTEGQDDLVTEFVAGELDETTQNANQSIDAISPEEAQTRRSEFAEPDEPDEPEELDSQEWDEETEEEGTTLPAPALEPSPEEPEPDLANPIEEEIKPKEEGGLLRNPTEPKRLTQDKIEKASVRDRLIKIADQLDQNGFVDLADKIDRLLGKCNAL